MCSGKNLSTVCRMKCVFRHVHNDSTGWFISCLGQFNESSAITIQGQHKLTFWERFSENWYPKDVETKCSLTYYQEIMNFKYC